MSFLKVDVQTITFSIYTKVSIEVDRSSSLIYEMHKLLRCSCRIETFQLKRNSLIKYVPTLK